MADPAECVVVFLRSGLEVRATPGEVILEVAERAGIPIASVCRGGTCGTCKALVRAGECEVDTAYALSKKQRRVGWILTCSSHAVPGRLVLDA